MPGSELLLQHVLPFGAVLARLAGIFLMTPAIGSQSVPVRVKALMALFLALALYPVLPVETQSTQNLTMVDLIPVLVGEGLIGLAIGALISLPVLSVQMGGQIMGQQMGLGIASVFNPALETEGDVVGQILLYLALLIFLSFDGLEIAHYALIESFSTVPIGGLAIDRAPLELFVGLLQSGMHLAIRIAAPILCILFLETVAVGFVMKTVPQLNILSFGFPVKIMLGIFTTIASLTAIAGATGVELERTFEIILDWVLSL